MGYLETIGAYACNNNNYIDSVEKGCENVEPEREKGYLGWFLNLAECLEAYPSPRKGFTFNNVETRSVWLYDGANWRNTTQGNPFHLIYDIEHAGEVKKGYAQTFYYIPTEEDVRGGTITYHFLIDGKDMWVECDVEYLSDIVFIEWNGREFVSRVRSLDDRVAYVDSGKVVDRAGNVVVDVADIEGKINNGLKEAVKYTPETRTSSEKAQARSNIDAIGALAVLKPLGEDIVALERDGKLIYPYVVPSKIFSPDGKSVEQSIAEEQVRATTAEQSLAQNLEELQGRTQSAASELNRRIEEEQVRATTAEQSLAQNLEELQGRTQSAASELSRRIAEEKNRAEGVEQELEGGLKEAVKYTPQDIGANAREQARYNIRAVGYRGTYGNTVVLEADGEIRYPEGRATSIKMSNGVDNVENVLIETKEKVDTFLADADTSAEAIDKLKELQEYIKNDETSASQMLGDIAQNRQDIAKEVTRAKQVEMYLERQKADKTGYYENMSVGVSDNLSGRGESSNAEFAMRPSGGENKSIKDGTARINSIRGNSVVWNQQIDNRVSTVFSEGGWLCRTGAQNISIENNVIAWQVVEDSATRNMIYHKIDSIKNGEWYYFELGYDSPVIGSYGRAIEIYFGNGNGQRTRLGNTQTQTNELKGHIKGVVQLETNYTDINSIMIKTPNYEECIGKTIYIDNFKFTNLTKMFNGVNVPTTVEEYEALYGNMPDDFNDGTIIDNHTSTIKSVGVNILDVSGDILTPPVTSSNPSTPKDWAEVGKIYSHINSDGYVNTNKECIVQKNINGISVKNDAGRYGVGFFAKCIPNAKYTIHANKPSDSAVILSEYDKNKVFIRNYYFSKTTSEMQLTKDTHYVFLVMAKSNNYDTAAEFEFPIMHLTHTGYLNDQYEPYPQYEDFIRELPTVEGGLKSALNAYDEIRYNVSKDKWEYVKRIGVVDLGTLDWVIWDVVDSGVQHLRFRAKLDEMFNSPQDDVTKVYNILNKKYNSVSLYDTWKYIKGISMTHANTMTIEFVIYDDAYTVDDAAKLKADLSGVMCYYELEEPIVTELDIELSRDYKVWDYGTEEAISNGISTPVKLNLYYGFNAVGQITDNTILIEELLARVAQLEAKITQVNSVSDTNEEE